MKNVQKRCYLVCDMPFPHGMESLTGADEQYVHLWVEGNLPQRYAAYARQLISHLHRICETADETTFLQLVAPAEGEGAVMQGLGALLRSAWREYPDRLQVQVVALDSSLFSEAPAKLLDRLRRETRSAATCVRLTDSGREVLGWESVEPQESHPAWHSGGIYWITGGLGGLGRVFARAIAEQVERPTLILSGRSPVDESQEAFVRQLSEAGAQVELRVADVADAVAMQALASEIQEQFGRLDGVIHAAGVLRDRLLQDTQEEDIEAVLAAKVTGLTLLAEAVRPLNPGWLLICSSVAGVAGNTGQAVYAAANAFVDHYALYWQSMRQPGESRLLSVSWPLWADGGMTLDDRQQADLRRALGLEILPTAAGLQILDQAFAQSASHVVALYGEADCAQRVFSHSTDGASTVEGDEPSALPEQEYLVLLEQHIAELLAQALEVSASDIRPRGTLERYGIDSVMAVNLTRQLETLFGALPATLFFEQRTVAALARYLLRNNREQALALIGASAPSNHATVSDMSASSELPARPSSGSDTAETGALDIAIIGLSGRYPEAADLAAYWDNLVHARDCISEIPPERWNWDEQFDPRKGIEGKSYGKWGGFIQGAETFDPLFFQLSPREAERLDPQERLFLQCAYSAIEDAGYTRYDLGRSAEDGVAEVGVFVGAMYHEYQLYGAASQMAGDGVALSGSASSIANRVSYFCDFSGPSLTLDTMCSSSLTAIHQACHSLRRGECQVAIAGGVNLSLHPNKYLFLSQGQFLSTQGRCTSFGEGGDGYVPGEGVGAAVLKPLRQAIADGDHIYGVIKGSAVNHGGRTNGYTVPNPDAQGRVIGQALAEAGIDPRMVSYVEAHGTGTSLGDPIEIAGLKRAFEENTRDRQYCALGSVKSNIGHCESAAGIAGLTKVLLQMQHGQLVPSLHSDTVNTHIDFAATPFVLQHQLAPWPRPVVEGQEYPRIAGISSFGAGGSNAHLIVEEYRAPPVARAAMTEPVLIVLSARDDERLQKRIEQLADCLAQSTVDLVDLAYTLQVGREAMDARLALLVHDQDELQDALALLRKGQAPTAGCYRGLLKRGRQALLKEEPAYANLARLGEQWVTGVAVDWHELYRTHTPQRMSLPTYPFATERCWAPDTLPVSTRGAASLHPLIQHNSSTVDNLRFSTRLAGNEWFLREHKVQGHAVVPGVVQLEWARAAAALALGIDLASDIALERITWLQALVVDAPLEVHIAFEVQADGALAYRIYSEEGDQTRLYSQGVAHCVAEEAPQVLDIPAFAARCPETLDRGQLYARFEQAGLSYGPGFRLLQSVSRGGQLALTRLGSKGVAGHEGFTWNPGLLDAALQGCAVLLDGETLSLPFALESIRSWGPLPADPYVVIEPAAEHSATSFTCNIRLTDENGRVVVHLQGLSLRPVATAARENTLVLMPRWTAAAAENGALREEEHWLVLCEVEADRSVASAFAEEHCVHLAMSGTPARRYAEYARRLLEIVHGITAQASRPVRLQLLVPASGEGALFSGLSGLLQSARQEYPSLIAQTIICDVPVDSALIERLRVENAAAKVRYSSGLREELEWLDAPAAGQSLLWRDGGVYWITGGLGGLGKLFAHAIAGGCEKPVLLLSGRSTPTPEHEAFAASLRALGATVEVHALDITDSTAVAAFVAGVGQRHGTLNGVIHSAGILRDRLLKNLADEDLNQVLAPKVAGVEALDEATRDVPLEWLLLCSSVAGLTGNVGQGAYAAANGFLDGFARHRQMQVERGERHGRTLSVAWPLWQEGGMQLEPAARAHLQRMTGMTQLPTSDGLAVLSGFLHHSEPLLAVLHGERSRLLNWLQGSAVPEMKPREQRSPARAEGTGQQQLQTTGLEQSLAGLMAMHLKLPLEAVERDMPFTEFGFDSVLLTTFGNLLNERFGLALSPTTFFEAPTLAELVVHLQERYGDVLAKAFPATTEAPAQMAEAQVPGRAVSNAFYRPGARRALPVVAGDSAGSGLLEPIAIIGISGRFPQSEDIQALWDNLRSGRDCIGQLPEWRWGTSTGDPVPAGVLDEVDCFDSLFFNISPREALAMDPQQRLLMEYVYRVIEDAGYSVRALSGSNTALLVGTGNTGYAQLLAQAQDTVEGYSAVGTVASMGPNRMSYWLNWHGPSEPIETACSSSLVAIHRAVALIRSGQCEQAVVGGINTLLSATVHESFRQAGMLSPDGHCKVFSADADGYVRGEGVGMLFLKPLSAAERDGDHIYGLVRGSAENHGGRAASLTAPNPNAQARVIEAAFRQAGIDPATVGYMEAHGTGTALGDPIEIQGLKQAFETLAQGEAPTVAGCGLGTIKSNIGHLEMAAGVAGVIKVLLQMRHGELVASLNSMPLNRHIELDNTPFRIVTENQPWPRLQDAAGSTLPRRAGVSSFGFGGVNAHVVLEEYLAPEREETVVRDAELIILSARDEERLKERVQQLYDHLQAHTVNLADLAHTLQTGREPMTSRLAVVASSQQGLLETLAAMLDGCHAVEGLYRGEAVRNDHLAQLADDEEMAEAIAKWAARGKLNRLAEFWVRGGSVDWRDLLQGRAPQRLSLPGYPFARECHWPAVDAQRAVTQGRASSQDGSIHPLLQRNVSDFNGLRYSTMLTGEEFFLREHVVQGRRMVPGVVQLEWARAAVSLMACGQPGNTAIRLEQVVWLQPLVVDAALEVHISLATQDDGHIRYELFSDETAGQRRIYSQGVALTTVSEEPQPLDLSRLHSNAGQHHEVAELYQRFERAGLCYGTQFRALQDLSTGPDLVVGRLQTASGSDSSYAWLPGLFDGALQAVAGLLDSDAPSLPFALSSVQSWGQMPVSGWVVVRPAGDDAPAVRKWDVMIARDDGRLAAILGGFTVRAAVGGDAVARDGHEHRMIPVWQRLDRHVASEVSEPVVITLEEGAFSRQAIRERLQALPVSNHLLWQVPGGPLPLPAAVLGLRLVQCLIELVADDHEFALTVVTLSGCALTDNEPVDPEQASVHGLIGSLAKEYPHWQIRLLDLPAGTQLTDTDWRQRPAMVNGDVQAWRNGCWHAQYLLPCRLPAVETPAFRQGGVYVVLGGAGGIGVAFSEYLIRRYGAQLIWLGRREEDAAIESQREQLAALGPMPLYLQADGRDPVALERARVLVVERFGAINGVVHAAITLADRSLAGMDEASFESALTAKQSASRHLVDVFASQSLDFLLFFGSSQSFYKAAGQSNYAAGCCYADAFAHELRRTRNHPVRVMHWGYWGSVGVVANETHRMRMARLGFGSIEPAEAMAALECLLAGPFAQMAFIKTTRAGSIAALQGDTAGVIEVMPAVQPVKLPVPGVSVIPANSGALQRLDRQLADLLWAQLGALGWLEANAQLPEGYRPWRGTALELLAEHGIDPAGQPGPLSEHWNRWNEYRERAGNEPIVRAQLDLLAATLPVLPAILRGEQPATDVLFPQGSMALVEGIYRDAPVAAFFNDILGERFEAYVQRRLANDRQARLRILEIGAGTGGTSVGLFKRLAAHAEHIDTYMYTDVSTAFLQHAQARYAASAPYLQTHLLDIEQPPVAQGFKPGDYDVVVATNVLHATRDIARTLRHAKALLKGNGVLLLNEISTRSLFTHLTFGLLEGWWLAEDTVLRIAGSPGLSASSWHQVLTAQGFLPDEQLPDSVVALGQQVIMAVSDGIVLLDSENQSVAEPGASTASPIAVPISERVVPDGSLRESAIRRLRKLMADTLKIPEARIVGHEPMGSYGMDSILAIQLARELGAIFGNVTTTVLFEHSTIEKLVDHFMATRREALSRWLGQEDAFAEAPPAPVRTEAAPVSVAPCVTSRPQRRDIAIIGLSGRYPQAADLAAYWNNLAGGRNCIREVPSERWCWQDHFDPRRGLEGKSYSKWGGFMDDIECFDPLFFNISPQEAEGMDPQERLFLQCAHAAIEDAGHTPATLSPGQRVGVFVGVMNSTYGEQPTQWSIANRVSYLFDFRGSSLAVDTACSSSLTAIQLAVDELRKGTIDCALAGGVHLIVDPVQHQGLSSLGMLSGGHECRAFGDGADGFVDGEGVGAALLKPLEQAIADGDHIYGVIKGSAINHGGRTSGYTVPSPAAQEAVISQALEEAGIDARAVSYVEAHGTGTALGDPIEIAGLSQAFAHYTQARQYCAIGSVKSNIGHCESAAGIAGLSKVLLQMKHAELVPSLHSETPNPHIDFAATPFGIQQQRQPWQRPVLDGREYPRVAGLSSFGAGGSNAHLIIEEYQAQTQVQTPVNGPVVIVLSARDDERLRAQVTQLAAYLAEHETNLSDLAYTLQVGREAMPVRLAVIVRSVTELQERLSTLWRVKAVEVTDVFLGRVQPQDTDSSLLLGAEDMRDLAGKWAGQGRIDKLAEVWVQGADLDWTALYGQQKPRRLSLPTYPFARERYWRPRSNRQVGERHLHPLVHRNTSDFDEQRYSTVLSGTEWFLRDHQVQGRAVVPAVIQLEWARAAVALALGAQLGGDDIALEQVVWMRPLIVENEQEVHICLEPQESDGIRFELYGEEAGERVVYSTGFAVSDDCPLPAPMIPSVVQGQCHEQRDVDALRMRFARLGVNHGKAFRTLQNLSVGSDCLIAHLSRKQDIPGDECHWQADLLDGALQALSGLMSEDNAMLPFALQEIRSWRALPSDAFVVVRPAEGDRPASRKWDVAIVTEEGDAVMRLLGVCLRPFLSQAVAVSAA